MNVRLSTVSAAPRRGQLAFTLMEFMVTVGIISLIMAGVMQTSMFTSRSFAAMGNYADLDRTSRHALDTMSRDIREAKVFGYFSTNSLWFTNLDNSLLGYVWSPGTQKVLRYEIKNGALQTGVLLSGCDYFSFRIWLRNPTNGFWFPYSANAQAANTKLVDVSWRCSRRVLSQYNTESVQTAKIVLRN